MDKKKDMAQDFRKSEKERLECGSSDKVENINRKLSVKDRLLNALIGFAGKKDLSGITVRELIEKSGVARASFYRNFKSTEEIIDYGIGQMARLYHEGKPSDRESLRGRELILYKFRFYHEHADLILAFHKAKVSTTLLDIITDCEIGDFGDMPSNSIKKYEIYYFSGAFYNMMLSWLESGAKESPEAMADEFLRIANNGD